MDADSLAQRAPTARFPISDHCDGEYFFNPETGTTRTLADVLRWQLTATRAQWPSWIDDPAASPPATPNARELVVTFVNHSTFLIRSADLTVVTDPVWSDRASPVSWAGPKRVRRPGLAFDDLPRVDVVLVSHNHYDHMDVETLTRLARRDRPLFVTGLGNKATFASAGLYNVFELDWWDSHVTHDIEIVMAPAQHFSARGLRDRNTTLWGSFLLRWPDRQVYFGADSGYASHFRTLRRRYGAPDLALLPIGAYEPRWFMREAHMNPAEAVRAHQDIGARRSLAMHFGTFRLTDEGIDEPARALEDARRAAGLSEDEFRVPAFGESIVL